MDRPKYVHRYKTRHGKFVFYYKEPGGRRIRLPDEYGTPGFLTAVAEAPTSPLPLVERRQAEFDRMMTGKVGKVMVSAVRAARTRSRSRGWLFDLSKDWALDQARAQGFRCALTGIPFFMETDAKSKVHPFTPSLDRIDCARGYTKDNVRIVVWAINAMLLDWGEEVFQKVAGSYRYWAAKNENAMLPPSIPLLPPSKSTNDNNALRVVKSILVRSRNVT